jgi:hypothetical protein
MIHLFVEHITQRLIYTLDFVFVERNLTYELHTNENEFLACEGPKLNYSNVAIQGIVQLIPASICFDTELIIYAVEADKFQGEDCLKINGVIDPLASIFYILSRMEEYTSTIEDEHGRFPATNSVLHSFDWLEKVMCDRWAVAFLHFLVHHELIVFRNQKHKVEIRPTFDIDNAYAYRLKSGLRKWMSTAKDVLKGNRLRISERKLVLTGANKDPYDTYDYIISIARRGFNVNMFWLLGDYAKYDKNISYKDKRHQRLIRKMAKETTVGIHPSYKSNSYEFYLLNEKERLEVILNRMVIHSRQHFLKLKIPVTYPSISTMGIEHDFTMGYADLLGFRAGTARPFKWFDLNKNQVSNLTIHPFAYMDGTLNEYMLLDTRTAKEKILKLFKEVEKYGGDFIFIWHNETIGNYGKWEGWKEVLEYSLSLNEHE